MLSLGRCGADLKALYGLMRGPVPGPLRWEVVRLVWDPGEQARCQAGVSHESRLKWVSPRCLWGIRMADQGGQERFSSSSSTSGAVGMLLACFLGCCSLTPTML